MTASAQAAVTASARAAAPAVTATHAAVKAGTRAAAGTQAGARTQASAPADPASYVNPLIGTGSGGNVVGQVDMDADFEGGGYSHSAQALAAAGVTPGSTLTAGGASYTWPDSAAGDPDNVVANRQVVTLNAAAGASSLDLLASATNGPNTGTVTVTYSDGSTASVPIAVTDWAAGSLQSGNTVAVSTPYRNCGCGSTVNGTTS